MKEMKNKLEKALNQLIIDKDKTFRVYHDRKVVGDFIFKALINKRNGVDSEDNKIDGFYLTSKDNEVGLMSRLYGITGLLSLILRYKVIPTIEEINKIKEGVIQIIDYVEKNGYDLSPYLDDQVNKDFFQKKQTKGKKISYIGARTWALSMLISARKVHLNGIIDFSSEMETIMARIKGNIQFFVNEVIRYEGEPIGWGYANGCEEPSLFFTYSVVEAFSDFDDNCLGGNGGGEFNEKKDDIDNRDNELLNYLNKGKTDEDEPLEKQYYELCKRMGDIAWEKFGKELKINFFCDSFTECRLIKREEILRTSRSSVLFNSLYVIFILFYSYKNKRCASIEENEKVESSMSLGLQLIQNFYDDLISESKDNIVDKHIIAFDQKHNIDRFSKELNDAAIQASSLLPMLAKANNLIAFYIYEFPQQKMGILLDKMLEAKLDNEWLWENRKFDLLSTERYLEAIADFFDYYDNYEREYAKKSTTETEITKRIRDEVKKEEGPRIRKEELKKISIEHKQEIERKSKEAASLYPIILISDTINSLSEYNKLNDEDKKNISLSTGEQLLNNALKNYIYSYLENSIEKAALKIDVKTTDLKKASEIDFHETIQAFYEFIANYNVGRQSTGKLSLKDIFKLIIKE